jgi:predicted CXXCH cytochrome family protein
VAGNSNLCMSCHVVGGPASAFPFLDSDQARPTPGLPGGEAASGNSHRWDSGPSGWVSRVTGNTSAGTMTSGGVFSGRFPKTYTVTVTGGGDVGAATFSWTATTPGGGSGSGTTGTDVSLDEGITVTFTDGASSPSFVAGSQWRIYVRTDLALPVADPMARRLEAGKVRCSTCHNQHDQEETPFDAAAPPYGGPGTGEGRHFQRVANESNQMCVDCHRARDVTQASQGSHPVAVVIPAAGEFKSPGTLPLDGSAQVKCMSCHQPHFGPASDGTLLRLANVTSLCTDCHTLADTATPGKHFEAAAPTLWPGGQYGSLLPAVTNTARQGACTNCHQPHGWPDSGNLAQDYPHLLADREESLCFTCHDGSPVTANIRGEILKAFSHPVAATSDVHTPGEAALVTGRHVECMDCHNPHQAKARVSLPGPSTVPRPATGPLSGAKGVNVSGAPVAVASFEYEICFRCHGDSPGKPPAPTPRRFPETNVRLEFEGSYPSYHPVTAVGKNPNMPSLIGGYNTNSIITCTSCHNNNAGPVVGGAGPNGPHGSTQPRILERRYDTVNTFPSRPAEQDPEIRYALCFKCHDWDSIRGGDSFKEHDKHIRGEDIPCNSCHDPHGSSGFPKLINFDTRVVSPFNGVIEYRSTGVFQGQCTLSCHGTDHDPFTYP